MIGIYYCSKLPCASTTGRQEELHERRLGDSRAVDVETAEAGNAAEVLEVSRVHEVAVGEAELRHGAALSSVRKAELGF